LGVVRRSVLPHGFHRIRHYGLLASGTRADNIARIRSLLDVPAAQSEAGDTSCAETNEPQPLSHPCPCCGGPHDHHRDVPARHLAGLPSRGIPHRDQDRHIMIKIGACARYLVGVKGAETKAKRS
jgi:hypothetical protein